MNATAQTKGLFASTRRLVGAGLELAQVRIELLAVELEQEKGRVFDGLMWAALALLLLSVGVLLLTGLLVMLFWDGYRLPALAVLGLLFVGGGLAAIRLARQKLDSPEGMLSGTRAELARDRQALGERW